MRKRLAAVLMIASAFGLGPPAAAWGSGRADTTVTITCQDFLGTTYQVVDANASGVLLIGNENYSTHNGFGGTCSAF